MQPWRQRSWAMAACSTWRNCSLAIRPPSDKVGSMSSNCRGTRPSVASEKKGGRKKASEAQPGLVAALEETLADHTAGSPVDEGVCWTNRSPREIAEELADRGFAACTDTV